MNRLLQAIDDAQQQRPWLAFPVAVIKKFGDDQAGRLAALVAYYGFFSLFPLLLVFVTVLGFVLQGNPELQERVLASALAEFPVLGDQIRENLGALPGSGIALAIGLAGALWGGMGVAQAAQDAMNSVWNVPRMRRPNFLMSRVRSLLMLLLIGGGVVLATAVASLGTVVPGSGPAATLGSLLVNTALFLVAFKVLTVASVSLRQLWPGALVAAVAWTILQALGAYLVQRQLAGATAVYGAFATVIGLLWWLHLGAQVTLLAAEVNVVRARRLWPRALQQPPLTEADEAVLQAMAREERRRPEQSVEVSFDRDA